MKTLSLSEAKMKLSALVEALQTNDEEVVITKNGKPAAVLVSPDEFASLRETQHVLFDSELMDDIVSLIRSMHPQLQRKVRAGLQAIQTDPAVGKAGLKTRDVDTRTILRRAIKRTVIALCIGDHNVGNRHHLLVLHGINVYMKSSQRNMSTPSLCHPPRSRIWYRAG